VENVARMINIPIIIKRALINTRSILGINQVKIKKLN